MNYKILLILSFLATLLFSNEGKYSSYPSKQTLNLTLNSPILLNPNADKYHRTFFANLTKAQLYIKRHKKLAFSQEEEAFLSDYNINFANISIQKSLLTGSDKDTAAQNFKFHAEKLSDALALSEVNTLDISFTIRDVLKDSIVLEGYKTIYEEGKFSFSEFYTITLDHFDINSFSASLNLLRFIILNPMKPYTNKEITPQAKKTIVQEYSKDTIKQISFNNKRQFIKVYAKNVETPEYKLSSYFKLTPNTLIKFNSDNEVQVTQAQAKEYCEIFDMRAIVTNRGDNFTTFKCIGTQQKRINYIPRYALKDTPALLKFKDLLANQKETIVFNEKKNINEIWDLELGIKVFSFESVYELINYDLPKEAHYMLIDKNYKTMNTLSKTKEQIFIYEAGSKIKMLNPKTQKLYTDLHYFIKLKKSLKIKGNSLYFYINHSVYSLYKEHGFKYQDYIAKYVIDTYIDPKTKLMWQNNNGLKKLSYDNAKYYCRNLNIGFVKGWRLPSAKEIQTIKERRGYKHKQSISGRSFIKKELFNSSQISWQNFWTSTKNDIDTGKVMGISFNFPNNKMWYPPSKKLYTRCVRVYK